MAKTTVTEVFEVVLIVSSTATRDVQTCPSRAAALKAISESEPPFGYGPSTFRIEPRYVVAFTAAEKKKRSAKELKKLRARAAEQA
jgi:hypothetical protein